MSAAEKTEAAPAEKQQPTAKPEKPNIEELFAQIIALQAENKKSIDLLASENKKSIDLMAQAIVKLNEKIEAKPNPESSEGTDWVVLLKELAGGGKPSSLEEAAKHVGGLVKFAEEMDRFRHPYDFEGALAKRLLWRHGLKAGMGIPRYMTKEELRRYDKYLDRSLGLEEEEGEAEHVAESE